MDDVERPLLHEERLEEREAREDQELLNEGPGWLAERTRLGGGPESGAGTSGAPSPSTSHLPPSYLSAALHEVQKVYPSPRVFRRTHTTGQTRAR